MNWIGLTLVPLMVWLGVKWLREVRNAELSGIASFTLTIQGVSRHASPALYHWLVFSHRMVAYGFFIGAPLVILRLLFPSVFAHGV